MATSASLFLGTVFFLDQRIWAQCGSVSQPSIWAMPGAVIPTGSSVTIFCRFPPGVTNVRLSQFTPGARAKWYDHMPLESQEVAEFHLQNMVHTNAGTFYCDYYKEGKWSVSEDKLDLVVTGVYENKPFLIVHSGPNMGAGGNVNLLCHTSDSYDTFILCRDGNASFPQNCSQQDDSTFLISPASPGDWRTYRCFGSYKDKPHLWSLPSDSVELSVTRSSPHPSIWAVPGAVVSVDSSVTIFCRIPPGVEALQLTHYAHQDVVYLFVLSEALEVAEFYIVHATQYNSGIYFCRYQKDNQWSGHSDTMELVVTDSSPSDYRTENYIRLCLAVLVLLVLGAVLLDAWKSRRVLPGASREP